MKKNLSQTVLKTKPYLRALIIIIIIIIKNELVMVMLNIKMLQRQSTKSQGVRIRSYVNVDKSIEIRSGNVLSSRRNAGSERRHRVPRRQLLAATVIPEAKREMLRFKPWLHVKIKLL